LEIYNADAIIKESENRTERVSLSAYFSILLDTNPDIFKELQNMAVRIKRRTFEEVFTEAGIIPEWMERGFKKGIVQGREEGLEKGFEHGREEASIQIAKNLLAEGSTHEFIHKITGLSHDVIKNLDC
jgi:predicted transposase/invertase (TIGR01784 family)